MTEKVAPVMIKKYANRRLYNTGTSTYVTLDDLAGMVKRNEEFTVQDAKTGEDITHAVLTQIIFELEGRQQGQSMLPIPFLRQLISFYGDQMQAVVPTYLEQSMAAFTREQERIRDQMKSFLGPAADTFEAPMKAMEEQTRRNMEIFQSALGIFAPFAGGKAAPDNAAGEQKPDTDHLADLREQIAEMQRKIDALSKR